MKRLILIVAVMLLGCEDRRTAYEKNINVERNGIGVVNNRPENYSKYWGETNNEFNRELKLPNYGGVGNTGR